VGVIVRHRVSSCALHMGFSIGISDEGVNQSLSKNQLHAEYLTTTPIRLTYFQSFSCPIRRNRYCFRIDAYFQCIKQQCSGIINNFKCSIHGWFFWTEFWIFLNTEILPFGHFLRP
jgi:hypothetical protein